MGSKCISCARPAHEPSDRRKPPQRSSIFPSAVEGKSYDYLYKLILIGDWNSGKSSCLQRFAGEEFHSSYLSTIGIDFKICFIELDGIRFKLQIWDTSGQDRFRTITRAFYRGTLGYFVFYNTTKQETFDNVPYWIEEVRKYGHPDATVMVVGNKSDLTEEKVVSYETAKDFADENDVLFFEVSAKDETNIELALTTLVAKIRQKHCELAPQDVA